MATAILDHRQALHVDEVSRVARGDTEVSLAPETAALLDQRREQVIAAVRAQREPAYGFNRGFGHNVKLAVENEALLDQLQVNLIRSHAMGLGEPAPKDVVRATMLLRASSLARGYSGVRSVVVQTLIAMLNADVIPVVPRHGSVSASGDLCPLSHIALALIGEGDVLCESGTKRRPAKTALEQAGIAPLQLAMKEGLALNNGCQYLTAMGILAADQLLGLLQTATICTALSAQVMLGSSEPFREDLHARRPHAGALAVAGWLRTLLADSPIQDVHADKQIDGEVQDPYNLRCAAQILGTCHDLIREARETFSIEANSVTDNPLILEGDGGIFDEIVSGGHFHGMPVAVKVYNLMQAMCIIARLSNMRCARFVDEARNKGLGSDLVWPELGEDQRAISSAMMAAEYTSASLTNWLLGQSMPSHLFSVSTDAGQEDHVSMGAPLALRLLESLPRLAEVLAVELAFATQAASIRRETAHFPSRAKIPAEVEAVRDQLVDAMREAVRRQEGKAVAIEVTIDKLYPWTEAERQLSEASEAVLARVAEVFPPLKADRCMSTQVSAIADLIRGGAITAAVKRYVELK